MIKATKALLISKENVKFPSKLDEDKIVELNRWFYIDLSPEGAGSTKDVLVDPSSTFKEGELVYISTRNVKAGDHDFDQEIIIPSAIYEIAMKHITPKES